MKFLERFVQRLRVFCHQVRLGRKERAGQTSDIKKTFKRFKITEDEEEKNGSTKVFSESRLSQDVFDPDEDGLSIS